MCTREYVMFSFLQHHITSVAVHVCQCLHNIRCKQGIVVQLRMRKAASLRLHVKIYSISLGFMVQFDHSSRFFISLALEPLENRCMTLRASAAARLPRALKKLPKCFWVLSQAIANTATGRYLQSCALAIAGLRSTVRFALSFEPHLNTELSVDTC